MNKMPTHKRFIILNMLIEGVSVRAVSRIGGVFMNFPERMFVATHDARDGRRGLRTLHDIEWIVGMIDARAPASKKRDPYEDRQAEHSKRDITKD
jgi:hypothetical protein